MDLWKRIVGTDIVDKADKVYFTKLSEACANNDIYVEESKSIKDLLFQLFNIDLCIYYAAINVYAWSKAKKPVNARCGIPLIYNPLQ
jgi:hypothetical protein